MTPTSSDVDTRQPTPEAAVSAPGPTPLTGDLLICLTPLPPEDLEATLKTLAGAFPAQQTACNILVATPDSVPVSSSTTVSPLRLLHYTSSSTALFLRPLLRVVCPGNLLQTRPLLHRYLLLRILNITGDIVNEVLQVMRTSRAEKSPSIAVGIDVSYGVLLKFVAMRLHPLG